MILLIKLKLKKNRNKNKKKNTKNLEQVYTKFSLINLKNQKKKITMKIKIKKNKKIKTI